MKSRILFMALIISSLVFALSCAKKDKPDNKALFTALYLLNEQSKKVTDVTPTCKVSVTSSGTTKIINAPFTTATATDQNFKTQGDEIAVGVSFQYYSVIKVTTKLNGKLIFQGVQGAQSTFFPKIFADAISCDVSYSAISLEKGTAVVGANTTTITFSEAGIYLIPVAILLDRSNPAVFVRYSD
jgi:hypothetical protein